MKSQLQSAIDEIAFMTDILALNDALEAFEVRSESPVGSIDNTAADRPA